MLGRVRPGLVGDAAGASAMRVPCSVSSRAARSASVKTVASRQAATRFSRTGLSPACSASLVCMSGQTAQPLIWLARILTSSCVAAGNVESVITAPDELTCFDELSDIGVAVKVESGVHGGLLKGGPTSMTPQNNRM